MEQADILEPHIHAEENSDVKYELKKALSSLQEAIERIEISQKIFHDQEAEVYG